MRRLLAFVPVVVGALAGCPASFEGKVDGESVPTLVSAFFVQDQIDAGGGITQFSVSASGVSALDACNGATKLQENLNNAFDQKIKDDAAANGAIADLQKSNATFVNAQVDFEKKSSPSDFWSVGIGVQSLDDKKIDGASVKVDIQQPPVITDGPIGSVSICRTNTFPIVKKDDDGTSRIVRDVDCFGSQKGSIDVGKWTKDGALEVTADIDLGKVRAAGIDPKDDSGSVKVKITAGWCETLEKALNDCKKLQTTANVPGCGATFVPAPPG